MCHFLFSIHNTHTWSSQWNTIQCVRSAEIHCSTLKWTYFVIFRPTIHPDEDEDEEQCGMWWRLLMKAACQHQNKPIENTPRQKMLWAVVIKKCVHVCLFSTDETATENILKAELTMASLCGRLGMVTPRDAFITAICKASLPPHYALTLLSSNAANLSSKGRPLNQIATHILTPPGLLRHPIDSCI